MTSVRKKSGVWPIAALGLALAFGVGSAAATLRTKPPKAKCLGTLTDADLFVLPEWPGTRPDYPFGLDAVPENRFLFGTEVEYGPDFATIDGVTRPRMNVATENLIRYYRRFDGKPPYLTELDEPGLRKLKEGDPDYAKLSADEKLLLSYLPDVTVGDAFPYTQELVSPILPNHGTFRRLLSKLVSLIGVGSFQGTVSVPRAAVLAFGKDEIAGLTLLSNDLAAFASLERTVGGHAFLSYFNLPLMNVPPGPNRFTNKGAAGANRGRRALQEIDGYFDRPDVPSKLESKDLSNPKYTRGLALRFDIVDKYKGKGRFFFEIRGCQYNAECVARWMKYVVHVFKHRKTGFARFAALADLFTGEPWRLAPAWTKLDPARTDAISSGMERVFTAVEDHARYRIENAFYFPLKDWGSLAPALGMGADDVARLARAQSEYVDALERASRLADRDAAVAELAPALRKFKRESGVFAHLTKAWQEITGMPFDVRY